MKLPILLFLALVSLTVITEAAKDPNNDGKRVKKPPPKTPLKSAQAKKNRDLNNTDTGASADDPKDKPETPLKKPSEEAPEKKKATNPADAIDVDDLLAEDANDEPEIPVKKKKPNLSDSINVDELLDDSDNDNELSLLNLFGNNALSSQFIDPRRLAAPLRLDTLRNIRQNGVGTGLKSVGKTLSIGEDVSDFFSDSLHDVHDFFKTATGFVDGIPVVGEIKKKVDKDISNGIELGRATKGALLNSGSKIFQNAGNHLTDQVNQRRMLEEMRSSRNAKGNGTRSNKPRNNRSETNGPRGNRPRRDGPRSNRPRSDGRTSNRPRSDGTGSDRSRKTSDRT